jgi:predicted phage terminase large subunit-like protein
LTAAAARPAKKKFQVMLHPVQRAFLDSNALFRGYVGGRGAGKTFVGVYDLISRACCKRDRLYMVVAPTYPLLKDSSIRTFLDLAGRMGKLVNYNKTDFRAVLDTGCQVIFRSAEQPDRLRGPNISGLWFDEAQGTGLEAFNVALGCLREDPEFNWCSATFTPRGKLHWTYDRFARRDGAGALPPDTDLFHCSSRDNPFVAEAFTDNLQRQYTTSAQDQEIEGEFIDVGGTLVRREWWHGQIVNAGPRQAKRVRYWDKASTRGGGCYTCGVLMAQTYDNVFYVESVLRGQWSTLQRDEIIELTAQLDRETHGHGAVRICVEQEPGSGGKDSLNATIRGLAGHIVQGDRPTGEKRVRAEPFAAQVEAGNVFLVRGEANWIPDYIEELALFPDGRYSDQMDASSGAFNQLTKGVYSQPVAGGGSLGAGPTAAAAGRGAPAAQGRFIGLPGPPVRGMPGNTSLLDFRPR